MAELTFYQWANALKGYMLALGVAFGIFMIVMWWRSTQSVRRQERESKARGIYSAYLLKSMELQDLARPAPADPSQPRLRAQYPTFVSYLVTVADEILLLCPTAEWEQTLRGHLVPHRALLASQGFRKATFATLTPELRRLIDGLGRDDAGAEGHQHAAE